MPSSLHRKGPKSASAIIRFMPLTFDLCSWLSFSISSPHCPEPSRFVTLCTVLRFDRILTSSVIDLSRHKAFQVDQQCT